MTYERLEFRPIVSTLLVHGVGFGGTIGHMPQQTLIERIDLVVRDAKRCKAGAKALPGANPVSPTI